MNNRQRQEIKAQLMMIHARPKYMGFIREREGCTRLVFIAPEHVQHYRDIYGDKIKIWG